MFTIIRLTFANVLTLALLILVPFTVHADGNSSKPSTAHFSKLFLLASSKDDATAVKSLLAQGMSPNQTIQAITNVYIPLTKAIEDKAVKIVKVLIDNGADINGRDLEDYTPLIYASITGNKAIFDAVMAAKPDLTCEDDTGHTALDDAKTNDEVSNSPDSKQIFMALTNAGAPAGDKLQKIHSQDRMLVAHVTDFYVDLNTGIAKITGRVSNLGDQHYSYVEISAKFQDLSFTLVDTSLDNVQSLDAHETWKFTISTLKNGVRWYQLTALVAHK